MTNYVTMAEVVRQLQTIPRHRISYALDRGFLPEPARISGRRMFTASDVQFIAHYFATRQEVQNESA